MVQIPYPLAQFLRLVLVLPLLTIAILPAVLWQLVGVLLAGAGTAILFIYISSLVIDTPLIPVGRVGFVLGSIAGVGFLIDTLHKRHTEIIAETLKETREISNQEQFVMTAMTQLSKQVSIPVPEVRMRDTEAIHAYTLIQNDTPTIVISTGVLEALSRDEITAVLAHELAHLVHKDVKLLTIALIPQYLLRYTLDSIRDEMVSGRRLQDKLFARGTLIVFGPILMLCSALSTVSVALLSRGREFAADRGAAKITGRPESLASALVALEHEQRRPAADLRSRDARIDMLNVLPDSVTADWNTNFCLTRTHPSLDTRLERLRLLET